MSDTRVSYPIRDAAAATGYSESTIRRAVAAGELPVHYPAQRPVILAEDLHAWVAGAPTERAS
jgi:predicted DNA-binding transcriptional regulator AlpA